MAAVVRGMGELSREAAIIALEKQTQPQSWLIFLAAVPCRVGSVPWHEWCPTSKENGESAWPCW